MLVKHRLLSRVQTAAIVVVATFGILTATLATPASAHEGREVGDYNLVVGFLREPAYEGQLNAVSLVVTKAESDSMDAHHVEPEDADQDMAEMTHLDAVDVMTHGAVFSSPQFGTMESFEFEIAEELSGVEIPYHVHPGDQEGVIVVSSAEPRRAEDQSIMIMDDHVMPTRLEANVGDIVIWTNHENQNAVVMSGPLSAMTNEMTSMMSDETPRVTAETETARNRVSGLAPHSKSRSIISQPTPLAKCP